MDSIGVNNLRSLKSIHVDLKPITIFIGKNSAGKSTLLRTLPLLKQTFETHTSEPVLWYGKYVDFGDFDQSLTHDSPNECIEFSFSLACSPVLRKPFFSLTKIDTREFQLTVACRKNNTSWITLSFDDQEIRIDFGANEEITKLTVNHMEYSTEYLKVANTRNFFPIIAHKSVPLDIHDDKKLQSSFQRSFDFEVEYVLKELVEQFKPYRHTNTKDLTIYQAISRIPSGSKQETYSYILQNKSLPTGMLKTLKSKLQFDSAEFKRINDLLVVYSFPYIWKTVREQIIKELANIRYSKPLRTTAERYYRIQGLSIDEVDPSGENVAMVMNSMRGSTLTKFGDWTEKTFGCRFYTVTRGGHVSVVVKDSRSNHEDNLADTGFGYSQVLPILLSSWLTTEQKQERVSLANDLLFNALLSDSYCEVIEQPELHLHPAFQAKLIDAFAGIVTQNNKKNNIKFILETHSETIVNRLGYLIYKKKLPADMVNVVVFNKNENDISTATQIEYTEKGQLKNWPIGFFDQDGV